VESTLDAKRTKEIQKVITPSLLGLILDELKAIRNLLTHPIPVASPHIPDYESFTRFLADRERVAAGNPHAPLPKGAIGCEACRTAYIVTEWDAEEDRNRKKNGPPCAKCDLPEDARLPEAPGERT